MDGGVDRRDDERLPETKLGCVLDAVVVGERLRRDAVLRRDREERLAREHCVHAKTGWILANGGERRAARDEHRAVDSLGTREDRHRHGRPGESPFSDPLELGRGDDRPDRDHARDHAARSGHHRRGPQAQRTVFSAPATWLAQDKSKRDIGRARERDSDLKTRRPTADRSPNLRHAPLRASSVPVEHLLSETDVARLFMSRN